MPKFLKCAQCGAMQDVLLYDPRVPPLDEGDCLCIDCQIYAFEEINEDNGKK